MKKQVDSKVGTMLDVTFEVQFTDEAITHYQSLDANITRRVDNAMDILVHNPLFGPNIVKLKGQYAGLYRYRVGRYKIIYRIDMQNHRCIIRGIYPRGKAYHS